MGRPTISSPGSITIVPKASVMSGLSRKRKWLGTVGEVE